MTKVAVVASEMSAKSAHVVLLCGLPGSGKSSLARLWKESNEKSASFDRIRHIEYDSVVRELQTTSEEQGEASFTDESLQTWKASRKVALSTLNEELECHFCDASSPTSSILIVMDDNFHLRSMRKEVYQICQSYADHDVYFMIVWLDVSMATCLERNRQRSPAERVPDDVIANMKVEPPDPAKANWEQGWIHCEDSETITTSLEDIRNKSRPVQPPPPPVDEEALEDERRKTRESQIHQYDGYLRSWVGAVARIRRTDTGKANAARKGILQQLRTEQDNIDTSTLEAWFVERVCLATKSWPEEDTSELQTAIQSSLEQS